MVEIGQDFNSDLTYEPDAVLALQTAAEDYIVELFEARDLFAYMPSCVMLVPCSTLRSHTCIRQQGLNAFTQDERF